MPRMKYYTKFSLKPHHTFAVHVKTDHFISIEAPEELFDIFNKFPLKNNKYLIAGKGSNLLFVEDFKGCILRMDNRGIKKTAEDQKYVYLRAAAGELWDDFVKYSITNHWYGAENMSYIPGSVGAAPVQNVGAYGAEAKDIVHRVQAFDIAEKQMRIFTNEECRFDYRSSIFKIQYKDRYIITSVDFRLKKNGVLKTDYGSLSQEAEKYPELSLSTMRDIIIKTRQSKLPDPDKIPNAGSFFKNPAVPEDYFQDLKSHYPNLVSYNLPDGRKKLAAGQLIDMAGFKAHREQGAGVHDKQALVLVNYGRASGKDILRLAEKIQREIKQRFGIILEPEVRIC